MSKKDYELIANCIRAEHNMCEARGYGDIRKQSVHFIALSLANKFARDNPRFDYVRFLTACGF